jgi:hypothetical protein
MRKIRTAATQEIGKALNTADIVRDGDYSSTVGRAESRSQVEGTPSLTGSPSYQGYVSPPGSRNEPLLSSEDRGYEIRSAFACVAA